jgi:hypothetical protein
VGPSTPDSARTYSIGAFVLGTFVFSWTIWLGLLSATHLGVLSSDSLSSLYGWGGLGPSLVAFVLRLCHRGPWQGCQEHGTGGHDGQNGDSPARTRRRGVVRS